MTTKHLFLIFLVGLLFLPFVSATDLTDQLVACYDLEADGTDSYGNNHLSETGSPTYASGHLGNAFSPGNNIYLSGGLGDMQQSSTTDFSVSFWAKQTSNSASGVGGIMGIGDDLQNEGDWIAYELSGVMTGNTGGHDYRFNNPSPDNTWYFWVFTWDESTDTMKLYQDTSEQTLSGAGSEDGTVINPSPEKLWLGRVLAQNGRYWEGQIDSVQIYDKLLNTTEISELYNSGTGLNCTAISGTAIQEGTLDRSLEVYYSLDDTNISGSTVYDLTGNYDGTNNGGTTGQTGVLNEGFDFNDNNSYVEFDGFDINTQQDFTYSFWADNDGGTYWNNVFGQGNGAAATSSVMFYFTADSSARAYFYTTSGNEYIEETGLSTGTNYMITIRYDALSKNAQLFFDGVNVHNTTLGAHPYDVADTTSYWGIGQQQGQTSNSHHGLVDEVGIWTRQLNNTEISDLYNSGSGLSYYDFLTTNTTPSTPTASERMQQDSSIEQNASVTVNSASYVPITSSSVTIADDTWLYGSATIPIDPSGNNEATCRITIDGGELNDTETSRSLTAGSAANILITSLEHYVASGTYDFGIECLRSPGGSYIVGNSSLLLHILTTTSGTQLETAQLNLTSATLPGLLGSTSITTSDNHTASGTERYLVAEWAANYDYSATNNISVVTELAGSNCTEVKRYGTSGSVGSVGGVCFVGVGNETNSTSYDFKVYGTGSGSVTNAKFHVKEFILHPGEINSTSLVDVNGSGTIASTNITVAGGHSNPDLIGQGILSVHATSGSPTGTFYLTADSQNSTFVSRASSVGEPGVLGVHKDFETVSGTVALSLVSDCENCTLTGQYLMGYLSSDVAATPNEFVVTANSVYGGAISEFSFTLSDGRSFSTTSGSVSVSTNGDGELYNFTIGESSTSAIPYFANTTTTGHNSTNDITLNLTPYTIINATYGGAKVNNFTVNGTTTTSGLVYVRIFNSTEEVNITDAVSDGGTNLSDQSANVTASPYLENYTFTMLVANSFNFSIYDELTEALITENMTIEIISDASAGTYTTTNGTLYLELLTPSDYTVRYYSTLGSNYTQRDYIQTLVDRQRYEITLYGLENDEATDLIVTVKDTSADPIEAAIVKLLRYFTSCNCYNVVEMATTSSAGEAYLVADAYDGHYKFAVEYQGETEFLSTEPENFIPSNSLITRTITINLGSAYFESFRELTDIARTLTYNNDTKGLSFTWNDPSGIVTRGCLYAEYLEGVHYTPVTPVCQNASTGSVVMTLNNSVSSYKYYAEIETSTTYSEYVVFSGYIDKIRESLLGGEIGLGALLGSGLIVVLALMFSYSAIAVMLITGVGVIAMSVLGVASLTTVFITGFATLVLGIAAYLMRS